MIARFLGRHERLVEAAGLVNRPGFWLLLLAALLLLTMPGCAPGSSLFGTGTEVQFSGQVCGSSDPVTLVVRDAKDRGEFSGQLTVTGPDGETCSVAIGSTDSSTSAAIAAQSKALADVAGKLIDAAIKAGTLP